MNFQKFETNFYCFGGRHGSGTLKVHGELTSKVSKLIIGYCSICNRKKSVTVNDDTMKAESLGDFIKNLGKKGLKVSKNMRKTLVKNPSRALDITANIATAATSRNPKIVMKSFSELLTFYNTGKGLYLDNIF